MVMKVKKDGAWREASSVKVKIAGEWRDVSNLYSKKDGAWITVYSAGVLVEFTDYPFKIPVAKGWKYSTDGIEWTKMEADGEINTEGGTFTGYIKANKLVLDGYYTEYIEEQIGKRVDGETLNTGKIYHTAFANGQYGYVCGGENSASGYDSSVDIYDSNGVRTQGTSLSVARFGLNSFVNADKGYVCGGRASASNYSAVTDVFDASGVMTVGTELSKASMPTTTFVNGGKGYVCLGYDGSSYNTVVNVFDSTGNRSSSVALSSARYELTSFVNNTNGYVCGGLLYDGTILKVVDVFDISGIRSSGNPLNTKRYWHGSFVNKSKGYVCGGLDSNTTKTDSVEVFDSFGNVTIGTSMSSTRCRFSTFVNRNYGYVCGGSGGSTLSSVDIFDVSGIRTAGEDLNVARSGSVSFVNSERGHVCGGSNSDGKSATVDVYYDIPESYTTNLPITAGSTYTLNGESGTASESKIMEFDSPVTGTIKYEEGGLLTDVVLLEFTDYPYPIPVAAGWKYSTGGSDWNEVTENSEINSEGTFTGLVWADSITLSEYYNEGESARYGVRFDGPSLSSEMASSASCSNNYGGCFGGGDTYGNYVFHVDNSGNITQRDNLSVSRQLLTAVSHDYQSSYFCGGQGTTSDSPPLSVVDIYDKSGVRTTGTPLSVARSEVCSFRVNSKGYICGGYSGGSFLSTVDVYDSSGNRTTGPELSVGRFGSAAFGDGPYGIVAGGTSGNREYSSVTDIYDQYGSKTIGTSLSVARSKMAISKYGHIGIFGGFTYYKSHNTVEFYSESMVMTIGQELSVARSGTAARAKTPYMYIFGGFDDGLTNKLSSVEAYDEHGIKAFGEDMSIPRANLIAVNASPGIFVCGGLIGSNKWTTLVDIYKNVPDSRSTKLPITAGTTYTLNDSTMTADSSQILSFDQPVSGTIVYAKGSVPSE